MQGNICRRIVVRGRVQGVFYRKSAKEKADSLKLTGSVKNLEDGSVELFVFGPEKTVNEFVKWCHVGPPLAHVTGFRMEEIELRNFDKFEIVK
jgi:acylphosphatase